MTPEERQRLKERIQELIVELEQKISSLQETSKPVALDQASVGRLSRMDSIANQAISGRVLAESQNRLARLRLALEAIDEDEFGVCVDCGEDIALKRLMAIPEASRCVDCAG